jgi:uncharacterized protein YidB (DUF937 family)
MSSPVDGSAVKQSESATGVCHRSKGRNYGNSRFTGKFGCVQGHARSAIVAKLQQGGLGDQVKSWIGNGQNLPITAEQLQQVLGSDTVKQLAARFNIPVDQLAKVLAQQLPTAVDHASPDGSLPHTA